MVKKLSYVGAFIIILFFVGFGFWRKQVMKESLVNGQRFTATIHSVDCTSGKEQSKLFFLDSENKLNHTNISRQDCYKYNSGDTLTVIYHEKQNTFFIEAEQK